MKGETEMDIVVHFKSNHPVSQFLDIHITRQSFVYVSILMVQKIMNEISEIKPALFHVSTKRIQLIPRLKKIGNFFGNIQQVHP